MEVELKKEMDIMENKIIALTELEKRILRLLRRKGPKIRDEIQKALNLKRTTAYDHLYKLEKLGLVGRRPEVRNMRGRPHIEWYAKVNNKE